MLNIDEFKYCICGENYVINKYIKIYTPTLKEVSDFGEDYYYHLVNIFTRKPYDIMVELDDLGVDYQTITDWDLFLSSANQIPMEYSCILFGRFDFTKLRPYVNQENGLKVLVSQEDPNIIIDEAIFQKIVQYLRYVHFISEKVEYDVGNAVAKKFLLDRMRRKQKKMMADYKRGKLKRQSQIASMVKFCVNNAAFKYNYETVLDMKINLLYESYFYIIHGDERRSLLYGVYNGTIDTAKLNDKSILDVLPDLHK